MNIRIVYRGQIKQRTGRSHEDLEVQPGHSLENLLLEIRGRYGREVDAMLFDEQGNFRKMIMIVLNGTQLQAEDLEVTILKEGDEIMLMSPIAGG